jgi:hypothetical protein
VRWRTLNKRKRRQEVWAVDTVAAIRHLADCFNRFSASLSAALRGHR